MNLLPSPRRGLSLTRIRIYSRSYCGHRLHSSPAKHRFDPKKLPDTPCRTRFAPSPTGFLHLGSLRTALYNYLLAKATGGQFILRIEDTDQSRKVEGAEEKVQEDLKWAGLSWDEGPDVKGPFGPYRQSDRLPLYDQHVSTLIAQNKAYRCFCSPEDLERHKREAHDSGLPVHYPGTCRDIPVEESQQRVDAGEDFAVRFKSSPVRVEVQDIVYSRYIKGEPEEDFVIRKRDGFPTYHFANVVDDRAMAITHVIRGALIKLRQEWLISTPKHVQLYNAFDWTPPAFAHVGLLVDQQRQKLSKRHQAANLEWWKEQAILPPALMNFLVLLGWHPPQAKSEVMTMQDMVNKFSLKFTKGDVMVSTDKIAHLQKAHTKLLFHRADPNSRVLREYVVNPLVQILSHFLTLDRPTLLSQLKGFDPGNVIPQAATPAYFLSLLRVFPTHDSLTAQHWHDFVAAHPYLFWHPSRAQLLSLILRNPAVPQEHLLILLESMSKRISDIKKSDWNEESLKPAIAQVVQAMTEHSVDAKIAWRLIYWVLTGEERGPALVPLMVLLGRQVVRERVSLGRGVAESRWKAVEEDRQEKGERIPDHERL